MGTWWAGVWDALTSELSKSPGVNEKNKKDVLTACTQRLMEIGAPLVESCPDKACKVNLTNFIARAVSSKESPVLNTLTPSLSTNGIGLCVYCRTICRTICIRFQRLRVRFRETDDQKSTLVRCTIPTRRYLKVIAVSSNQTQYWYLAYSQNEN